MHMPRAVGVFRKAGFEVDAYPVDYLTTGAEELWTLPRALMGGIGITDLVVHEWIGLLAYWITGRISELFPGPISEISLPAGSIYNGSERFRWNLRPNPLSRRSPDCGGWPSTQN